MKMENFSTELSSFADRIVNRFDHGRHLRLAGLPESEETIGFLPEAHYDEAGLLRAGSSIPTKEAEGLSFIGGPTSISSKK